MEAKSSKNRRKFGQKTCAIEVFLYISYKNAVFSVFGVFSFGGNINFKFGGHGVAQVGQHHRVQADQELLDVGL
jgi:hypothetical protein